MLPNCRMTVCGYRAPGKARAYNFRLAGSAQWLTYVGPVRNRDEAQAAIEKTFREKVVAIRVHRVSDPWAHASARELAA